MKFWLMLSPFVFGSLVTHAEVLNFKVNGMHCDACKQAIEKNICGKGGYAQCSAKVISAKDEVGELKIETKAGQKTMPQDVIKALDKIGYKAEVQTPATTPAKKGG